MRKLKTEELAFVSGGLGSMTCTPASAANDYYGIRNTSSLGGDLVSIYEGLVFATSHMIERVARAL